MRTPLDVSTAYLAHPLGGDVDANVERAVRWLAWLMPLEPHLAIVAPWLPFVQVFRLITKPGDDDRGHPFRERCMRDNLAVARRFDGIILCGGTFSQGMREEQAYVETSGGWTADLTELGPEPPPEWSMQLGTPTGHGRIAWATRSNR